MLVALWPAAPVEAQTFPLPSAAQTPNQAAVAYALDLLPNNDPLIAALRPQTMGGARLAYDALSGEVYASAGGALLEQSRYPREAVLDRLRQPFGRTRGTVAARAPANQAVAYVEETTTASAALAYASAKAPVTKAAPAAPAPAQERVVAAWTQAIGAWGRTDGDGNAARFDRSLAGFISGVDVTYNETWRLGIAGGYTRFRFDVDDRSSPGSADNRHLEVYGGGQFGALALRSGASVIWHDVDTTRTVVFPGFFDQLRAGYNAHTSQIFGEIGYGLQVERSTFEPYATVAHVRFKSEGFTEIGGPAALSVTAQSLSATFTTLGLRAASAIDIIDGLTLTARGALGWRHAFGDITPDLTLAFASNGVPFRIAGVPIARDAAAVEAGIDLDVALQVQIGLTYVGQIAQDEQEHAVKGSLMVRF